MLKIWKGWKVGGEEGGGGRKREGSEGRRRGMGGEVEPECMVFCVCHLKKVFSGFVGNALGGNGGDGRRVEGEEEWG